MTRRALLAAWLVILVPALVTARGEMPRVPFSGALGATSGAGSLTGWDRLGGENPAASGAPGWAASASGHAPFGLEEVKVLELAAARDLERAGASLALRTLLEDGAVSAARLRAALAARLGPRWSGGGALRLEWGRAAGSGRGLSGDVGILWRPASFAALGAAWEAGQAGLGADCGTRLGGAAWRYSLERFFGEAPEFRHGLALRLHPLLSVHAGFAPARETVSLGVRFGAGSWEGFSALRRHAALGGTAVQGVRWRRLEAARAEFSEDQRGME